MTPGLGKEVTSWMLAAAAAGAAAVTGKLLDLQSIDTELFWLPGLTSLAGTAWLWVRRRELEASRLRQGYAAASFLFGAAVAMVVADVLQDNRWHSVKPGIVIGFGIAAAWTAWRCVPQAPERAVARKVAVVLVVLPALALAVIEIEDRNPQWQSHWAALVGWLGYAAGMLGGVLPEIAAISAAGIALAVVVARKSRTAATRIATGSPFVALTWCNFIMGSGLAFSITTDSSISLLAGLASASVVAILGAGALFLWRPRWVVLGLALSLAVFVETPRFWASMLTWAPPGNQQAQQSVKSRDLQPSARSSDVLGATADQLNKSLPIMVDSETQLVSTEGLTNTFVYRYLLVNYAAHEVGSTWLSNLPSVIRQQACTTPQTRDGFLGNGVTIRYTYTGKDGVQVASVEVAPSDCDPVKPNVLGSTSKRGALWKSPNGRYAVAFPTPPKRVEADAAAGTGVAYQLVQENSGVPVMYALTITNTSLISHRPPSTQVRELLEGSASEFARSLGVAPGEQTLNWSTFSGSGPKLDYLLSSNLQGHPMETRGFWVMDGRSIVKVSTSFSSDLPESSKDDTAAFRDSFLILRSEPPLPAAEYARAVQAGAGGTPYECPSELAEGLKAGVVGKGGTSLDVICFAFTETKADVITKLDAMQDRLAFRQRKGPWKEASLGGSRQVAKYDDGGIMWWAIPASSLPPEFRPADATTIVVTHLVE